MEGKQDRSGPHPNDKEPQTRLSRASLPPPAPPGPGSQIHPALPHQRKWWLLSQPNPGPVATDSPNWAQQPHQGHSSTLLFAPPPTSGFPASLSQRTQLITSAWGRGQPQVSVAATAWWGRFWTGSRDIYHSPLWDLSRWLDLSGPRVFIE